MSLMASTRADHSIALRVFEFMQDMKPLKEFGLSELYRWIGVDSPSEKAAVRAAFQSKCLGMKVAERTSHAEVLALRVLGSKPSKYCALPGLEVEVLREDFDGEKIVDAIKAKLSAKYSREVLEFWVSAKQRRSVDHSTGMRKARDYPKCLVCGDTKKTAAHIVGRKIRFWKTIERVHDSNMNLFSTEGVEAITQILKNDKYHSSEDYILPLCKKHDDELKIRLRSVIEKAASRGWR